MQGARTAFITGGMGGLGTAISRRLYDAGMTVLIGYSKGTDKAAQWLAREQDAGRQFHAYALDVSDFESCARCAEQIFEAFERVDIVVNNAGVTRDSTFAKMGLNDWNAVLRTDLDSMFNVTKQFLDRMIEHKHGRIINISSVNGSRGAYGQTNYAAAKAGVHGFTMSLALEMARHGVTVNTVSPGYLATAMVEAVPHDILVTKILPQIPLGRLGQPEEVAALIGYLCSEEAAFMTGANLAINGGMHMG